MPQMPRIKKPGHSCAYHVITRVNSRAFRLSTHMKKQFITTLEKLRCLFYVRYCGYSVLSNHYHLLVNIADPDDIDPQEAIQRWNDYHDKEYRRNASIEANRTYVVNHLTDISYFMKRLNVLLTNAYNRHTGTAGTLWSKRYYSNIIERGIGILQCGAYIELNSFRASLTARPEDYPYSSIHHLKNGNYGGLVAIDLLEEGLGISDLDPVLTDRRSFTRELFRTYLSYIYEAGTRPQRDKNGVPEESGLVITEQMKGQLSAYGIRESGGMMWRRSIEYSRGKFIGGEDFARRFYEEHINRGYWGGVKEGHMKKWLHNLGSGVWGVFNGAEMEESLENTRGSP